MTSGEPLRHVQEKFIVFSVDSVREVHLYL